MGEDTCELVRPRSLRFEDKLQFGQVHENRISQLLLRRDLSLLPIYDRTFLPPRGPGQGGPRVLAPGRELRAPDILMWRGGKPTVWIGGPEAVWLEIKSKSTSSEHEITKTWVTGIDVSYYNDYCYLADNSPWPVWILIDHVAGKGPHGLYGNDLAYLREHEHHRHKDGGGAEGMVYWAFTDLKKIDLSKPPAPFD